MENIKNNKILELLYQLLVMKIEKEKLYQAAEEKQAMKLKGRNKSALFIKRIMDMGTIKYTQKRNPKNM